MREALLFCFNLKKSAAKSHWMLVEAYGDNALSETTCRDWFHWFNDDNFEWQEWKSAQEGWGLSIAGSFGRGRYPIAKNACRAIGYFSSSHFHAATCHGEGSKDRKMGAVNWMIGRWSDAKTHAKFCLPDKKESRSCIGFWQVMKSGSIFRILNARNLGLIPPNHQHLPQNQIASDGRWCCAFDEIRRVSLRVVKTWWNCLLTSTTNNWSNCTVLCVKKAALSEKTWQADFPLWQITIAHVNNGPKLLGDTQLGSATPSCLLSRPGLFWLSSVFFDGPRARWAALRFLQRCPKIWWVVCLER